MKYRRNVDFSRVDTSLHHDKEDINIHRLHFGGKLNVEAIRLLAILDNKLALELLKEETSEEDFRKSIQLQRLNLQEIDSIAPDLANIISIQSFFIIYNVLPLSSLFAQFEHHPLIVQTGHLFNDIGMYFNNYLNRSHIKPLQASYWVEEQESCLELANSAKNISRGLSLMIAIISSQIEDGEDVEFFTALTELLESIVVMIMAICRPVCPDSDCKVNHQYPNIKDANKELLTSVIKLAVVANVIPLILRLFERRYSG